jgi:hypothetical protein
MSCWSVLALARAGHFLAALMLVQPLYQNTWSHIPLHNETRGLLALAFPNPHVFTGDEARSADLI